ncbi:MAG: hypothetical protein PHU23_19585, partial [Dehalococcoidales bacterium]|nr:hypothetical protein [Dehalococcoidales bacterium]
MPVLPQVDMLNFNPQIVPGKGDVNPVTRPDVSLYGVKLALAPIDPVELMTFQAQFADLMSMVGSDERKIMLARVEQYMLGLRAVKQALSNVKFTGVNASDTEIGMALIRPQFLAAGVVGPPIPYRTNWGQALTAVWADWIWQGAGLPMTMGKDFGMTITHIKSLVSPTPFMTEARFVVGRAGILLPIDVRNLGLADTENNVPIVPIPTMILIPKDSFYARARSDVPGTDNVPLGG